VHVEEVGTDVLAKMEDLNNKEHGEKEGKD
jgi:hypothetical protein